METDENLRTPNPSGILTLRLTPSSTYHLRHLPTASIVTPSCGALASIAGGPLQRPAT